MRQFTWISMPRIIHHQASLLHLLLNVRRHSRVRISGSTGFPFISIPINTVYLHAGMFFFHLLCNKFGFPDMVIVVSIVAHHANHISPRAGVLVLHIINRLVHQNLGFRLRRHRETADTQIYLIFHQIISFAIIQKPEIVFHHETGGMAERILRFVTKQIIIRIKTTRVGRYHTVVPHAVAEQQEVAGHIGIRRCTVIQHFHKTAIGRSIRCPGRELIINLVGTHDLYTQAIHTPMSFGQTLRLCIKFTAGWNNDNHVGGRRGMQILIGHLADIRGRWKIRIYIHCHIFQGRIGYRNRIGRTGPCTLVFRHRIAPTSQTPQLQAAPPIGIYHKITGRSFRMTNVQKSIPHFELPAVTQLKIAQTGIHSGRRNQSDLGSRRSFMQGIQCISLRSFSGSIVLSRSTDFYGTQLRSVYCRIYISPTRIRSMCRKTHFQGTTRRRNGIHNRQLISTRIRRGVIGRLVKVTPRLVPCVFFFLIQYICRRVIQILLWRAGHGCFFYRSGRIPFRKKITSLLCKSIHTVGRPPSTVRGRP